MHCVVVQHCRHPDCDEMLAHPDQNPLPSWHPPISSFQNRQPQVTSTKDVNFYHPDVDHAFAAGTGIDPKTHPNIHKFYENELPATHPNLQTILVHCLFGLQLIFLPVGVAFVNMAHLLLCWKQRRLNTIRPRMYAFKFNRTYKYTVLLPVRRHDYMIRRHYYMIRRQKTH
jgi:hypothetical protein